ncbi:MAG: hypothetical protein IT328_27945 [Caldilineaceae bacterium]|nr:hypothetical protein [Caldilineaceae bacterium]
MFPERWVKFLRRVMGLRSGRYAIYLTITQDALEWNVIDLGSVERARD